MPGRGVDVARATVAVLFFAACAALLAWSAAPAACGRRSGRVHLRGRVLDENGRWHTADAARDERGRATWRVDGSLANCAELGLDLRATRPLDAPLETTTAGSCRWYQEDARQVCWSPAFEAPLRVAVRRGEVLRVVLDVAEIDHGEALDPGPPALARAESAP